MGRSLSMTNLETLQLLLYLMSGGFIVGITWSVMFSWTKWGN